MFITRGTKGKLDARIFPSAIASGYKSRRYLGTARLQHSVDLEGVDIRYSIEPHVSREHGLKVRERQRWRKRGGRYRRESANGSINFMGALRWFQGCCLVGFECKGCLAWESRAPTIILPFHQEFPSYEVPFPWCSVRFSLVDAVAAKIGGVLFPSMWSAEF